MDWISWTILGGAIVAFVAWKQLMLVGTEKARECLNSGALVVDVRSTQEFAQDRVKGTVNIPLDELQSRIGRHAPDKDQIILLHCLSGGRSGAAKSILKTMGYRNCFNLGSLGRARRIIASRKGA